MSQKRKLKNNKFFLLFANYRRRYILDTHSAKHHPKPNLHSILMNDILYMYAGVPRPFLLYAKGQLVIVTITFIHYKLYYNSWKTLLVFTQPIIIIYYNNYVLVSYPDLPHFLSFVGVEGLGMRLNMYYNSNNYNCTDFRLRTRVR